MTSFFCRSYLPNVYIYWDSRVGIICILCHVITCLRGHINFGVFCISSHLTFSNCFHREVIIRRLFAADELPVRLFSTPSIAAVSSCWGATIAFTTHRLTFNYSRYSTESPAFHLFFLRDQFSSHTPVASGPAAAAESVKMTDWEGRMLSFCRWSTMCRVQSRVPSNQLATHTGKRQESV